MHDAVLAAQRHVHANADPQDLFEAAIARGVERRYSQRVRDFGVELAAVAGEPQLRPLLNQLADALYDPLALREAAFDCAFSASGARTLCQSLFHDSLATAEEFPTEIREIGGTIEAEEFEQIRGSTSVLFKVRRDGSTFAAFKPVQEEQLANYRGEIASYRLSALLQLAISVPNNIEVRVNETTFLAMTGADDIEGNAVNRLRELTWFDLEGTHWLYGTLKEWIPGFTSFPLEITEVWDWLVSVDTTANELATRDLQSILQPLATVEDVDFDGIIDRCGEMDATDFAVQLSDLHVFDALINNFDRYQTREFGRNVQFNHQQFVSLDNGASFQHPDAMSDVVSMRHLRTIEVFSRSTISALRHMDLEFARDFMFPNSPHTDESAQWAFFLERRERVLAYVDDLIAEHGERAVLRLP